MFVTSLSAEGYRNLIKTQFSPSSQINVIYGDNAQGKSNLLEAIWIFTGGRSFRGAKDAELVRFQDEKAALRLGFFAAGREQEAQLFIENGRRRAVINGVTQKSPAALVGRFCATIFSPDHLSFIKDGPSERRKFLDAAICQIKPSFATSITRYNKIISQRNTLLKELYKKPYLADTLDSWNEAAAAAGAVIIKERRRYLELLKPEAEALYQGISDQKEQLSLCYQCSFPCQDGDYEAAFRKALQEGKESDLRAGITTAGPHRDDLTIQINQNSARSFGSQGQQRSAILALKLSEAAVLRNALGENPVILLDDVLSELDSHRQDYLLNHIRDFQVFITCCDPTAVFRMIGGRSFQMAKGVLSVDPEKGA